MQTQLSLNLGIEERVDVRSMIVHGDIERETPKAKHERPTPEFKRVLVYCSDCAFRRRCGNRSQMLVVLVTQSQYYVADERTGSRQPLQGYDAKGRTAVVAMLNSGASARYASVTWCAWRRRRRVSWGRTPCGTCLFRCTCRS